MTYNDIRANVIGLGGAIGAPAAPIMIGLFFYPNNKNQLDC